MSALYEGVMVERGEHVDDGGLKLPAALTEDFRCGLLDRPGVLVGSPVDQRVEYVSHRHDATGQGDRVSGQSAGSFTALAPLGWAGPSVSTWPPPRDGESVTGASASCAVNVHPTPGSLSTVSVPPISCIR